MKQTKYKDATHSICNLKFNVLDKIPVVFHSGSNYYHNIIVKELASKFQGKFECLVDNTEK